MAADGPDLSIGRMRADAQTIFEAALRAVLPDVFLPPVLPLPKPDQNVVVFAAGKAAGSMAVAAEAFYLRAGLNRRRLSGLSIARHGYALPLTCLASREAGHPFPDQAGLEATVEMMARAKAVQPDDLVVFLLSGGASANLVAPAGHITLAEKQDFTRSLLKAGVPIDGINTVRKHISRVKGGRLAAMMPGAEIVTLALSDVPGDDISLIGSGPTVPDPTTLEDARGVVRRFGLEPPASIAAVLADPAFESPKPGSPVFARSRALVAARPADAWRAAVRAAQELGYSVVSLGQELEGEAREVAASHAERVLTEGGSAPVAWLSGGELTVTIRGEGRGGPNQEYALALANSLEGARGIVALAADTDGTDGGVGQADDPAGAFIDETTLARASVFGANAARHFANNDSTPFFRRIGDLFTPGPTFTNANDLRIILKRGSGSAA